MTEPAPRRRRLPQGSARYLAVAVLLAGIAYVTYDTQQQVHRANDERAALQKKVTALTTTVDALTAENKRLTTLLLNAGIDPRHSASPVPSPVASRARTLPVPPTTAPRRTTAPRPARTSRPSRSPSPRATRTPTPHPSPTSTCRVGSPLGGRCLVP